MSRSAPKRKSRKATTSSRHAPAEDAAENVDLRGHALAPDLDAIGRFIRAMIARGAIAELVTSLLALVQRMRELNADLMANIAAKSRARPPSELRRRLQLELPLIFATPANDTSGTELEGPPEPPTTLVPSISATPDSSEEEARRGTGREIETSTVERFSPNIFLASPERRSSCRLPHACARPATGRRRRSPSRRWRS